MLFVLVCWQPAAALAQVLPTATPDEAGVIYAIVQPDDTMWAIAGRAGISLAQLLEWNGLQESDFIVPGQKLIVGYGEPPTTPTPDVTPTSTATRPPPTPRPASPTPPLTAVCLSAFHDNNGNGLFDAGEPLQAAVAFTVYTTDAVIANYVTDGVSEPHCVPLTPGSYQIARSVGVGEVLTSSGSQAIILGQGDMMLLAFGGRVTGATAVPPTPAVLSVEGAATRPYPAAPALVIIGSTPAPAPTSAPSGGQPISSISLIPLAAVIIGGLLLTLAAIYFVRTRP
ncbi:MAG TPA: LysM peptidoglycan-binding domain-containing protein [Chloroflexota bacterium]|nr:LysM peptidoglycan-binding domain-containing protein [Chloroflexota bacterium]